MAVRYPSIDVDLERDVFAVWVRWVSLESPPSPEDPPGQGIRVELSLNANSVLGPTIVYRRDLSEPVSLLAHRVRAAEVLRAAEEKGRVDVQLTIHGSVANAPWAGLFLLRDHDGENIGAGPLPGTPLLQVQPSTPGDRWHVAGQAHARFLLTLSGKQRRLRVVR